MGINHCCLKADSQVIKDSFQENPNYRYNMGGDNANSVFYSMCSEINKIFKLNYSICLRNNLEKIVDYDFAYSSRKIKKENFKYKKRIILHTESNFKKVHFFSYHLQSILFYISCLKINSNYYVRTVKFLNKEKSDAYTLVLENKSTHEIHILIGELVKEKENNKEANTNKNNPNSLKSNQNLSGSILLSQVTKSSTQEAENMQVQGQKQSITIDKNNCCNNKHLSKFTKKMKNFKIKNEVFSNNCSNNKNHVINASNVFENNNFNINNNTNYKQANNESIQEKNEAIKNNLKSATRSGSDVGRCNNSYNNNNNDTNNNNTYNNYNQNSNSIVNSNNNDNFNYSSYSTNGKILVYDKKILGVKKNKDKNTQQGIKINKNGISQKNSANTNNKTNINTSIDKNNINQATKNLAEIKNEFDTFDPKKAFQARYEDNENRSKAVHQKKHSLNIASKAYSKMMSKIDEEKFDNYKNSNEYHYTLEENNNRNESTYKEAPEQEWKIPYSDKYGSNKNYHRSSKSYENSPFNQAELTPRNSYRDSYEGFQQLRQSKNISVNNKNYFNNGPKINSSSLLKVKELETSTIPQKRGISPFEKKNSYNENNKIISNCNDKNKFITFKRDSEQNNIDELDVNTNNLNSIKSLSVETEEEAENSAKHNINNKVGINKKNLKSYGPDSEAAAAVNENYTLSSSSQGPNPHLIQKASSGTSNGKSSSAYNHNNPTKENNININNKNANNNTNNKGNISYINNIISKQKRNSERRNSNNNTDNFNNKLNTSKATNQNYITCNNKIIESDYFSELNKKSVLNSFDNVNLNKYGFYKHKINLVITEQDIKNVIVKNNFIILHFENCNKTKILKISDDLQGYLVQKNSYTLPNYDPYLDYTFPINENSTILFEGMHIVYYLNESLVMKVKFVDLFNIAEKPLDSAPQTGDFRNSIKSGSKSPNDFSNSRKSFSDNFNNPTKHAHNEKKKPENLKVIFFPDDSKNILIGNNTEDTVICSQNTVNSMIKSHSKTNKHRSGTGKSHSISKKSAKKNQLEILKITYIFLKENEDYNHIAKANKNFNDGEAADETFNLSINNPEEIYCSNSCDSFDIENKKNKNNISRIKPDSYTNVRNNIAEMPQIETYYLPSTNNFEMEITNTDNMNKSNNSYRMSDGFMNYSQSIINTENLLDITQNKEKPKESLTFYISGLCGLYEHNINKHSCMQFLAVIKLDKNPQDNLSLINETSITNAPKERNYANIPSSSNNTNNNKAIFNKRNSYSNNDFNDERFNMNISELDNAENKEILINLNPNEFNKIRVVNHISPICSIGYGNNLNGPILTGHIDGLLGIWDSNDLSLKCVFSFDNIVSGILKISNVYFENCLFMTRSFLTSIEIFEIDAETNSDNIQLA